MIEKEFTYVHFLTDDEFIKWRLYPTAELNEYWSDFIKNNPDCKEALEEAIEKFKSVHINKTELSHEKIDELLNRILHSTSAKLKRKKRLRFYYWSSAACLLLLVASTVFIQFIRPDNEIDPNISSSNTIVGKTLPSENIQLISGNKALDIKQNAEIQLSEKGEVSIIEDGKEQVGKTELDASQETINKLIVPYGKRSTLVLSDGTKVWLNSGSELLFPTRFQANERHITVSGEIFIDVAEDKHSPFYVHTSQFDVRVHGTKFNISSYHDSSEKSVVLVEGKVEITATGTTKILSPGELFSWESGRIRYGKVNIDEYISWKDGIFIFRQATVSDILKKIGRYYNVNFNNNQSQLSKRTCSGKLFLSEDIGQVMDILSVISNTSYKKSGNNIYIDNSEP